MNKGAQHEDKQYLIMTKFLPFKEKTKKLFHCCYRHPPAFHLFPFAVSTLKKERERCLAFCDGHVYPLIQIDILTKNLRFFNPCHLARFVFISTLARPILIAENLHRMELPPWPHPDKYHSTIWAFSKQVRDFLVPSPRYFDLSVVLLWVGEGCRLSGSKGTAGQVSSSDSQLTRGRRQKEICLGVFLIN